MLQSPAEIQIIIAENAELKRRLALRVGRRCCWCKDTLSAEGDTFDVALAHAKVCAMNPLRKMERDLADAHRRIQELETGVLKVRRSA